MADPFSAVLGTAVSGGIAGGIGNAIGGIFGGGNDVQSMSTEDKQWQLDMVRLGNQMDLANQNKAYDHRLTRMKEHGLTSVEMFGSPGASPGGGTTGSGQTLGNNANQQALQNQQLRTQQRMAARQQSAQAATQLAQTKMQTDAQKYAADRAAGVETRGQDINMNIAMQTLNLKRAELANKVRETTATIGKTEQETRKLINEVATSHKSFVTAMKQLSMGPQNLLVELTMQHHGIDVQGGFANLPETKRQEILNEILALSSTLYVEGAGSTSLATGAVEGAKKTVQSIWTILKEAARNAQHIRNQFSLNDGGDLLGNSEQTQGNGARFSEPGAYGPNMNHR